MTQPTTPQNWPANVEYDSLEGWELLKEMERIRMLRIIQLSRLINKLETMLCIYEKHDNTDLDSYKRLVNLQSAVRLHKLRLED